MTHRAVIIDFLYGVSSDGSGTATANKDEPLPFKSHSGKVWHQTCYMNIDKNILYHPLAPGVYKQLVRTRGLTESLDSYYGFCPQIYPDDMIMYDRSGYSLLVHYVTASGRVLVVPEAT